MAAEIVKFTLEKTRALQIGKSKDLDTFSFDFIRNGCKDCTIVVLVDMVNKKMASFELSVILKVKIRKFKHLIIEVK